MNADPSNISQASDTLILVDEQDNETGSCEKVNCHIGDGKLHRAFSVFLFNPDGELLIQQRSGTKMLWPLIWANSCCSHPRLGEDTYAAANRRMQEELGVTAELRYLYKFVYHARYGEIGSEHENCWVFAGHIDGQPNINRDEIAAWRFISPEELSHELANNGEIYSPWLKLEWKHICEHYLADLL